VSTSSGPVAISPSHRRKEEIALFFFKDFFSSYGKYCKYYIILKASFNQKIRVLHFSLTNLVLLLTPTCNKVLLKITHKSLTVCVNIGVEVMVIDRGRRLYDHPSIIKQNVLQIQKQSPELA